MYEYRRRQSLKLYLFFKIKFLSCKKCFIVVDGCARGLLFHRGRLGGRLGGKARGKARWGRRDLQVVKRVHLLRINFKFINKVTGYRMETNVDTLRILLVELQATVNLGMFFNWLIVVIHNVRHIHLLHVKTFQNN